MRGLTSRLERRVSPCILSLVHFRQLQVLCDGTALAGRVEAAQPSPRPNCSDTFCCNAKHRFKAKDCSEPTFPFFLSECSGCLPLCERSSFPPIHRKQELCLIPGKSYACSFKRGFCSTKLEQRKMLSSS